MLDFKSILVKNLVDKPFLNTVSLLSFIVASLLVLVVAYLWSKPDTRIVPLAACGAFLLIMMGTARPEIEYQKVYAKINTSEEKAEQLLDGETVIKQSDGYYFVDVLTRKSIKRLKKTGELNRTVAKDFKEFVDSCAGL